MHKKSIQLLGILHTLLLVQCQGQSQRLRGRDQRRGGGQMEPTFQEREIRRASGFPVSFFDGEDNVPASLPDSHYPEGHDDSEEQYHPLPYQHPQYPEHRDDQPLEDNESDHDLFDPMEEEENGEVSPEHSVLGGDGGGAGGAASGAAAVGLKQDENPLNFLNLAGTDFQPGRMVNIFFGLMIMIFMIVIHGYILWIVGIAYLPGTRSFGGGWDIDTDALFTVLDYVLDAIQYWNDMQIVELEPPLNKD